MSKARNVTAGGSGTNGHVIQPRTITPAAQTASVRSAASESSMSDSRVWPWATLSSDSEVVAGAYRSAKSPEVAEKALSRLLAMDGTHDLGDGVQLNVADGGAACGGSEEWTLDGECHREGGPAFKWNGGVERGGDTEFRRHGKFHNESGPAFIRGAQGREIEEYWVDGLLLDSVTKQPVVPQPDPDDY